MKGQRKRKKRKEEVSAGEQEDYAETKRKRKRREKKCATQRRWKSGQEKWLFSLAKPRQDVERRHKTRGKQVNEAAHLYRRNKASTLADEKK